MSEKEEGERVAVEECCVCLMSGERGKMKEGREEERK